MQECPEGPPSSASVRWWRTPAGEPVGLLMARDGIVANVERHIGVVDGSGWADMAGDVGMVSASRSAAIRVPDPVEIRIAVTR